MKKREAISFGMMIAAGLLIFGTSIVSRAYDPDASETRLFLDYWPFYTVGSILLFVAVWMISKKP